MAAICFMASAWKASLTLVSLGQKIGSMVLAEKRWFTWILASGMKPEEKYCAVAMVRCMLLA